MLFQHEYVEMLHTFILDTSALFEKLTNEDGRCGVSVRHDARRRCRSGAPSLRYKLKTNTFNFDYMYYETKSETS